MKMNKNLISRLLLSTLILMCSGAFAWAQNASTDEYPKVEIFAGFSALGENPRDIRLGGLSFGEGYATPTGFEASVIRNFTRHIGLKGDFSAHFKNDSNRGALTLCTPTCTTATQDFEVKTRVYNFLVGPEFKARNSTRFTPFAHLLGGVAHTSANFTTPGPTFNLLLKRSDTGFAMALGGGLDIRATRRVSFRGQIDYNPVFIREPSGGTRDFVRISLGVLFH
jgi:opacity protein-like surface antigen